MKTPNMTCRVRPKLRTLVDEEIARMESANRTEVVEKSLCQHFGIDYERVTTKSKSD